MSTVDRDFPEHRRVDAELLQGVQIADDGVVVHPDGFERNLDVLLAVEVEPTSPPTVAEIAEGDRVELARDADAPDQDRRRSVFHRNGDLDHQAEAGLDRPSLGFAEGRRQRHRQCQDERHEHGGRIRSAPSDPLTFATSEPRRRYAPPFSQGGFR